MRLLTRKITHNVRLLINYKLLTKLLISLHCIWQNLIHNSWSISSKITLQLSNSCYRLTQKEKTYFTAGFFDLRNIRASFEACATKAACCGSLRLPMRDEVPRDVRRFSVGATTIPADVNGLIPRLNPSSSLITAIKRRQCMRNMKFLGTKRLQSSRIIIKRVERRTIHSTVFSRHQRTTLRALRASLNPAEKAVRQALHFLHPQPRHHIQNAIKL